MKAVLIQFKNKWEDIWDNVAIAENKTVANKYIDKLKKEYPDCYGEIHGQFYLSDFNIITEAEME